MCLSYIKIIGVFLLLMHPFTIIEGQQSKIDPNVRGNSFGLENFLHQIIDNSATADEIRDIKKVKPIASYKTRETETHRQSKPTPVPGSFYIDKPVEYERFGKIKDSATGASQQLEISPEFATIVNNVTERGRTRVVMRRRKRPPNVNPKEGTEETTQIGSLKSNRITLSMSPSTESFPISALSTPIPFIKKQIQFNVSVKPNQQSTIPVRTKPYKEEISNFQVTKSAEIMTSSSDKKNVYTERPSTISLKTFLKQQTETLSLSELLQTRNLSLADLLKGNKNALVILKNEEGASSTKEPADAQIFTKIKSTTETTELKSNFQDYPKKIDIFEITTLRPISRIQTKIPVIKMFQNHINVKEENVQLDKEPKFDIKPKKPSANGWKGYNVETQTRTTDPRLKVTNKQRKNFTPSKQTLISTTPTTVAPTREVSFTEIPVTSLAHHTKNTETPLIKKKRIPFKSTNNPDISLVLMEKRRPTKQDANNNTRHNVTLKTSENKIPQNENLIIPPARFQIYSPNQGSENSNKNLFSTEHSAPVPMNSFESKVEDYRKTEIKDDLIELLNSTESADELEKILQSRNMTLQEIIYNREKPTVYSNIEELFSAAEKLPSYNLRSGIFFDNQPNFNDARQNKQLQERQVEDSRVVGSVIDINKTDETLKLQNEANENYMVKLQSDDMIAETSNTVNLAVWKISERSVPYDASYVESVRMQKNQERDETNLRNIQLTEDDIISLETLQRNQAANSDFNALNVGHLLKSNNFQKSYIPPAVKSAIIASGVVMGIALFIFIAIFAMCGWKQRQIRIKNSVPILSDVANVNTRKSKQLSEMSLHDINAKKKPNFEECGESSFSGIYLWNTLKSTFTNGTNTLKTRLESEKKLANSKKKLRKIYQGKGKRPFQTENNSEFPKPDRSRNLINTSFGFKRSSENDNIIFMSDCNHGY